MQTNFNSNRDLEVLQLFDMSKNVCNYLYYFLQQAKENFEGLNGTTRTITLQTLMSANVLQPGKAVMTIDYLGQKFLGDLMPDGKIKSQETETVFLTPSAWAVHCKRFINPEKKSGCGWASVKYKGKKLDVYKNSWLRKCAMQKDVCLDDSESGEFYIFYKLIWVYNYIRVVRKRDGVT